ncbi:MAG: hypothetical protein ACK2T0_03765 [Anaerolineales bacterium]
MSDQIEIGRLLRSSTGGFVVGCRVDQLELPSFGALVRAALGNDYQVFGLIHDIHIGDDGLVRQIVTAENVSPEVVSDNRERRVVPVELAVLALGYQHRGELHHALPPRPPVSLDLIYLCDEPAVRAFTPPGRYAYLRLLLAVPDLPIPQLLAAHIRQAAAAHADPAGWKAGAVRELVLQLRGDYSTLTSVLDALHEAPVDL